MMSADLIRAALVFLQRVDIKGGEAMARAEMQPQFPRRANGADFDRPEAGT
jgi:hypothetical protein